MKSTIIESMLEAIEIVAKKHDARFEALELHLWNSGNRQFGFLMRRAHRNPHCLEK
jgi:hypothetical protein